MSGPAGDAGSAPPPPEYIRIRVDTSAPDAFAANYTLADVAVADLETTEGLTTHLSDPSHLSLPPVACRARYTKQRECRAGADCPDVHVAHSDRVIFVDSTTQAVPFLECSDNVLCVRHLAADTARADVERLFCKQDGFLSVAILHAPVSGSGIARRESVHEEDAPAPGPAAAHDGSAGDTSAGSQVPREGACDEGMSASGDACRPSSAPPPPQGECYALVEFASNITAVEALARTMGQYNLHIGFWGMDELFVDAMAQLEAACVDDPHQTANPFTKQYHNVIDSSPSKNPVLQNILMKQRAIQQQKQQQPKPPLKPPTSNQPVPAAVAAAHAAAAAAAAAQQLKRPSLS